MVIKVYISSACGNMEIKKKQQSILQVLDTRLINYQEIDISDQANVEEKRFMQENSDPAEDQKKPLPPQIFSDNVYCGDYDSFWEANECEELDEFLKLRTGDNED